MKTTFSSLFLSPRFALALPAFLLSQFMAGNQAAAQALDFAWVKQSQGTSIDVSLDLALDSHGNSLVTGYFSGTNILGDTSLTSSGGEDIFIAKYDGSGNVLWAVRAGGTENDRAHSIAVDAAGNSYITGIFRGTITFGSSTFIASGSFGYPDVFIAKYDPNGNLVWARKGGGANDDQATGVAVDAAGNSYITGMYAVTATFGSVVLSAGGSALFSVKYDPAGNVVWAKTVSGPGMSLAHSIAVDSSGNTYLAGQFDGTTTFGTTTLSATGLQDIFIAKYDAAGNVLWAKQAGGSFSEAAFDIAIDNSGNSYITGSFQDNATFGSVALSGSGFTQIFIAKYNSAGDVVWAKKVQETGNQRGQSIAVDASGNSYVTGYFQQTADFGVTTLSTTAGSIDMFVAKYDASGNALWAKQSGGTSWEYGHGIAIDAAGASYITGGFNGTATIGSTTLTTTLPANTNGAKHYVTKLNDAITITTGLFFSPPLCAGETFDVPFTFTGTFLSNNIFTAQLSDANGFFGPPIAIGTLNGATGAVVQATLPAGTLAASGYRIRVVASEPATFGSESGGNIVINSLPDASFTFQQTGCCSVSITNTPNPDITYSYNWGDNTPAGATPTHQYSTSGTYSITQTATNTATGCTASSTQAVSIINGIADDNIARLRLFPNPSPGQVQLEWEAQPGEQAWVEVTTLHGQLLKRETVSGSQHRLDLGHLANGAYLVKLANSRVTAVTRIMLQQ